MFIAGVAGPPLFPPDFRSAREIIRILFGDGGVLCGILELVKRMRGEPIPENRKTIRDGNVVIDFTGADMRGASLTVALSTVRRMKIHVLGNYLKQP